MIEKAARDLARAYEKIDELKHKLEDGPKRTRQTAPSEYSEDVVGMYGVSKI